MANIGLLLSALHIMAISSALLLRHRQCEAHWLRTCRFNAIYQLGDSISDTGNLIHESAIGAAAPCAHVPYGENFPWRLVTGRCSNGFLIIDFLCKDQMQFLYSP